jgi:hypothetical protein
VCVPNIRNLLSINFEVLLVPSLLIKYLLTKTNKQKTASMINSENQQNPTLNKAKSKNKLQKNQSREKGIEIQESENTSQS